MHIEISDLYDAYNIISNTSEIFLETLYMLISGIRRPIPIDYSNDA